MHKLSDTIDRKFIDTIDVSEWEVATDTGWEDITHIHKTIKYVEWKLLLKNGLELICADTHIVFDEYMNEVFVKDLTVGSKIQTQQGIVSVKSIIETDNRSNMFDITVNSVNHRFYTNGILSHNTTTAVGIILHYIIFNEHKTVAILANKGDSAREVLARIKLAYEALPIWLQHGIVEWNKGSIELENGCKVYVGSSTSSSIRGKSISFLYIDEAAFVEGYDEFFTSVYPTISAGVETKLLLTSTPNGLNHFHKMCKGAEEGTNGYQFVKVMWDMVPGRTDKWKQETLEAMDFDEAKFAQEYCCEFMGSSGTLIDGPTLKALTWDRPIHSTEGLSIYENPIAKKTYICIVDVSRGKALDYSAFHIIDVSQMPYNQVCTYRNNLISPTDYSEVIHRVITHYNNAYTLVEINDIGGQVADMLQLEFEVETLLFTESAGRSGKRISGGWSSAKTDKGIRTTTQVKSLGCSMLKLLLEQNQLLIRDNETVKELSTFSKKANSYAAEPGCHDDLVMGLVLFGWLSTQTFFKDITDINTMMKLREKTDEEIKDDLMPFGFTYDDLEQTSPITEYHYNYQQYSTTEW